MARMLGILLALTIGCGRATTSDDPNDLAPFESGTRLGAVYLDGGDGAVRLSHWRDRELGIDCRMEQDESWAYRCMPNTNVGLNYLDASCTELAFEWDSCDGSPPPAHVRSGLRDRCIGRARVEAFVTGDTVSATTIYGLLDDGTCEPHTYEEPRTFYRATRSPPSTYALATERDITLDSGLAVRVVETAGGAYELLSGVDTSFEQRCTIQNIEGQYRCLSGDLAYDFGFNHTDASCTAGDVAYSVGSDQCDPPNYVLKARQTGTCGSWEHALHTVGAEISSEGVYEGGADSCRAAEDRGRFWSVGAPATELPPAVEVGLLGSGRLRVEHYVTPQGATLRPAYEWWDATRQAHCTEVDTTTAGLRCVPSSYDARNNQYSDSACTEPLARVWIPECGEVRTPEIYLVFEQWNPCNGGPVREALAVGAEHTGAIYELQDGSGCVAYEPQSNERFHTLGAALPLEDYPAMTRVSD